MKAYLQIKRAKTTKKKLMNLIFFPFFAFEVLRITCCEMEKPIIMSPSGTSHDIVAESARRCMTDTLTGAGGRSGGE